MIYKRMRSPFKDDQSPFANSYKAFEPKLMRSI